MLPIGGYPHACSLGDKVYVLDPASRTTIKVLQNPSAPVSSQEIHWQDIEVPRDVPIPRSSPVFAPLNSTEIVIIEVAYKSSRHCKDIITFDTTTCEFKKEVACLDNFRYTSNRSANFCKNTIVALVERYDYHRVLKYTKGDTSATILFNLY